MFSAKVINKIGYIIKLIENAPIKEKADFYLKNLDKLIEIGENGYNHGMEYHITEKRVQYIFDIINEEITWKHD